MTTKIDLKIMAFLLITTFLLTACGGGGGGGDGGSRNQAPIVSVNSPGIIEERSQVQLSINTSDPDGTIRSIRWVQSSGPTINFTDGTDTINFIAPEVSVDTDFSFSISVTDNIGAITSVDLNGTILNVERINNTPIATDTTLIVNLNTSLDFSLPGTDPDGDVLIFTITTDTENGLITVLDAINNLYRYTPNFNSLVDDELTFEVSDGELSATGKVTFDLVSTKISRALRISDVYPPQNGSENLGIELYNDTGKKINLADFSIKTDSMNLTTYLISDTLTIALPEKTMEVDSYLVIQYQYAFNHWNSNITGSWQVATKGDNVAILSNTSGVEPRLHFEIIEDADNISYSVQLPGTTQLELTGVGVGGLSVWTSANTSSSSNTIARVFDQQRYIVTTAVNSDDASCSGIWYQIKLSKYKSGTSKGWICGSYALLINPEGTGDTDKDSMTDKFEIQNGFDPNNPYDAILDTDADGLINLGEFFATTNPLISDTDKDGMTDGFEIINGFDPLDTNDCNSWMCGSSQ
ncbi:MAG: hypothetical protein COA74_13290 [Gammaproteobacteria bacterium]|nr:MAG: hypothetical protein COA74_13290 [Gammaproteobacteria bacterium]